MAELKDYRNVELKYYALANVLIVMLLYKSTLFYVFKETISLESIITQLISAGLLSSIIYVYIFILDSIIPSQLKNKICYLFFLKQPGFSIFTNIRNGKVDARFTKEDAETNYSDIYAKIDNEPDKVEKASIENRCWYRIYRKYSEDNMIFTSHRDYLLCRDLCIVSIFILLFYILACYFLSVRIKGNVIIFFLLEILFTDITFLFRGKRFAYNVIALDLSKISSEGQ